MNKHPRQHAEDQRSFQSSVSDLQEAFDTLARDVRFSERIAALFHRAILEASGPPGRAVDLGCGTGSLSRALAACGFSVLGIDFAPEMVTAARSVSGRSDNPSFEVASIPEFVHDIPEARFVLVVAVKALHHLSPSGLDRTLRAVATRLLLPGGRLVILDLFDPRGGGAPSSRPWITWLRGLLAGARTIGLPGLLRLPWAWAADRRIRKSPAWHQHLAAETIPSWSEWSGAFSPLPGFEMTQVSPRQFILLWVKGGSPSESGSGPPA